MRSHPSDFYKIRQKLDGELASNQDKATVFQSGTLTICLGETDFPATGENRTVPEGPSVWEMRAPGEPWLFHRLFRRMGWRRVQSGAGEAEAEPGRVRPSGGRAAAEGERAPWGLFPWRTENLRFSSLAITREWSVRVPGALQSQVGILYFDFKENL